MSPAAQIIPVRSRSLGCRGVGHKDVSSARRPEFQSSLSGAKSHGSGLCRETDFIKMFYTHFKLLNVGI